MTDASTSAQIRRLRVGDRDLARRLFAVMAEVFEESSERLSDSYLDALLGRETFWAIAALSHDEVVGGLTAHTLAMTRAESSEVFIYDVAVRADHQRRGVGRQLVTALCAAATAAGFGDVFVPADSADGHALDFYRALGGVPAPVTMFTFSRGQPDASRRMPSSLIIELLAGPLSICRLPAGAPIPAWATAAAFFTVTRTADELSIICATDRVPDGVTASGGWRALKIVGPFDLAEVGILLRVAAPLAAAEVSMLPVATYDTDYVLVRAPQLAAAVAALRGDGHELRIPETLTDAPAI